MNTTEPVIRSRTLSDQVYDYLVRRIVAGELEPGSFVREEEVSGALDVSRTPVREALSRLASTGFLERMPHRGYRVPPAAYAELLDTYPIIATLELLAGRLAFPRVTAADLDALRALNRQLAESVRDGREEDAIEANERFHADIAELAGNRRLTALLVELRRPLRRLERWYYSDASQGMRSVAEHDALIDALETGDVNAALGIFEQNMALTRTALEEQTALP